ncbi:MAG: hypothetical protein IPK01_02840 [Acidobacteria bacterium]|nr:hypothetical protein [Acidobacteriota bacterium]
MTDEDARSPRYLGSGRQLVFAGNVGIADLVAVVSNGRLGHSSELVLKGQKGVFRQNLLVLVGSVRIVDLIVLVRRQRKDFLLKLGLRQG